MAESSHRRFVPEHAVPVSLSTIANSKTDRIEFGKVELVRVQVMGIVESIEFNECDMDIMLTDENNEHHVMVQKIFSSAFPRDLAQQLQVGHLIEVYGKIRVLDEGDPFLNALALHIVTDSQFEAFQTICRVSKIFYEMHTPALPQGTNCKVPQKMGLSKRLGNLDRFPVHFLEESTSIENNMGDWPVEIEQLATGVPFSSKDKKRKRVDPEAEESFKNEDRDMNGRNGDIEEEQGSSKRMRRDVPDIEDNDAEDSFDAGPVKVIGVGEDHYIEIPQNTEQAQENEITQTVKQTENNEDVPDSFDDVMKVSEKLEQNDLIKSHEDRVDFDDSFDAGVTEMKMAGPVEQAVDEKLEVSSTIVDSFEAGPLKSNEVDQEAQAETAHDKTPDIEYDSFENA
ncbi:hypothetical protein CAEBREN_23603 [Caenorhabditis brenneri]|uniref:Uncharacterized protein n=1 Tax=Caenorhabditis brenneri TaxID=135651 RepID=G0MNP9_CAEBE|nr:hypothetical protein CAEBREN_23603 [Caenorhabditis brenneri]